MMNEFHCVSGAKKGIEPRRRRTIRVSVVENMSKLIRKTASSRVY